MNNKKVKRMRKVAKAFVKEPHGYVTIPRTVTAVNEKGETVSYRRVQLMLNERCLKNLVKSAKRQYQQKRREGCI